jgi:hypothetical protein
MKVAPIEMQRALILGLHTGQREGDLLRMPWSAYNGTSISLRQGKSRRGGRLGPLVEIPCTAALRHAGRHGPYLAVDSHHENRSITQEEVLRPAME